MLLNVESAVIILVFFVLIFIIASILKNNSIVDIFWGLGFIFVATYHQLNTIMLTLPNIIFFLMILIWGLRLTVHILIRNWGKQEDSRYKAWRKSWKKNPYITAFFQIFLVQAVIMYVVSIPIFTFYTKLNTGLTYFHIIGVIVWLTGFVFEAVSDNQLKKFIETKKSKTNRFIKTGLWKYSRHPNYFGEALIWWGIFIFSFSFSTWHTLLSPLTITIILIRVSIPLLEDKYRSNKEFKKYKKTTPLFFPKFW